MTVTINKEFSKGTTNNLVYVFVTANTVELPGANPNQYTDAYGGVYTLTSTSNPVGYELYYTPSIYLYTGNSTVTLNELTFTPNTTIVETYNVTIRVLDPSPMISKTIEEYETEYYPRTQTIVRPFLVSVSVPPSIYTTVTADWTIDGNNMLTESVGIFNESGLNIFRLDVDPITYATYPIDTDIPISVVISTNDGQNSVIDSTTFRIIDQTAIPPTITQDLSSALTVYQPDRPVVSVTATNADTYTWYVDGVIKQGPSPSATFQIISLDYILGEHVLRVDAINANGSASSICALTILLRPAIIPIGIVDPAGGIASGVSGGVLTVTGGNGGVGEWVATGAPTVNLVDPSDATLTVATMTSAYNTLIWTLGQSRALQTEPRIWFGQSGSTDDEGGVVAVRPAIITIIPNPSPPPASIIITPIPRFYAPYPAGEPYTTVSVSDVMAGLNGMFAYLSDKIRFSYIGGRVILTMTEGDVKFTNPSPISFGSGERILARLFNRADLSSSPDLSNNIVFDQIYTAPLFIRGNPLTIAETGIVEGYPVPAGVYPGTISQQISASSINVFWAPSVSVGVIRYYVYVRKTDDSFVSCNIVSNSPFLCTGLEPNTQYKIQVITSTAFEISQNNEIAFATTKPI